MSRFADVTSDTPHGPRPVPEGHIPTDDAPPRGRKTSALVWGGLGLAAVVGALAARAAASALHDDPPPAPRPRSAPRYAALDPEAQRAMRSRAQADFHDYDEHAATLRAAARRKKRRPPPPRRGGAGLDIGTSLRNIAALLTAANAALEGFRQVSANSDQIMREFGDAADKLRDFLGLHGSDDDRAEAAPPEGDDPSRRTHKL